MLIKTERDKIKCPTDLLCGECSGEKGMEKYNRLIEIPNKYSVNLEKVDVYYYSYAYFKTLTHLNLSLEFRGATVSSLSASASR